MIVKKASANSINDVDTGKRQAKIAFATYGSPDRDKDVANKGMFSKSWQEFKDVRFFENHDKKKAPGKIKELAEDNQHAYAIVQLGTHTLGEDTLKQMAEGIITDSSYNAVVTKWKDLSSGGINMQEVFHKEVSVLTHWGAHPESKVISVEKAAGDLEIAMEILKELGPEEVSFLKNFIAAHNSNLQTLVNYSINLDQTSDLYYWINEVISSQSHTISRFKDHLRWYGPRIDKQWTDGIQNRLDKLKCFCSNTTASDECIQNVLREVAEIENHLGQRTVTGEQPKTKHSQQTSSLNDDTALALMNLNLMLTR